MNVLLAEIYNIYLKCHPGRKWEEKEKKKKIESQETIEKAVKNKILQNTNNISSVFLQFVYKMHTCIKVHSLEKGELIT